MAGNNKPTISELQKKKKEQKYQQLVNASKPKPTYGRNLLGAFLVGGAISLVGQVFLSIFAAAGLSKIDAGAATAAVMVFLGALLTGLGVYDNIAKVAGAGSIIPITGFANSIVSPALEFKREGYVFGVGSKMFIVAGPVLVYGFLVSVIIGLVFYIIS